MGLQYSSWHVPIQNCLWESLSFTLRDGVQGILGNKTTEHGDDYCSKTEEATAL